MKNNKCFFKKTSLVLTLKLSICLIMIFSVLGCATTKATVKKSDFSAEKYKLIYLRAPDIPDHDPREVFPEALARLEKLGFKVIPFSKEKPIIRAQGSGFVIDPKGFILTSEHIFKNEKVATLWIKGKRYEATVIKADKDKDLALLKINEVQNINLKALPIDNSQNYKMGQEVYTIGFPLSDILGNSPRLNKGLVSATVGLKDNPDHLQVSVEVQPGNSGGPLFDSNGNVIGLIKSTLNPMNVFSRTGGSLPQSVNFAVKSQTFKEFFNGIHEHITLDLNSSKKVDFDKASESIAQVWAGNVTEDFLKQPKMVCFIRYSTYWDIWYRFKFFNIQFYDMDTGDLLLEAGIDSINYLSTMEKVIDQTFENIKEKFFPGLKKETDDMK